MLKVVDKGTSCIRLDERATVKCLGGVEGRVEASRETLALSI